MKGQAASGATVQTRRSERAPNGAARFAFRRILFATDLSTAAEKALPYALEIARRHEATLYVIHAITSTGYPYAPVANWPQIEQQEEQFRSHAKRRLEHRLEGVPHEIEFRHGEVLPLLQESIASKQIDLLVIGTHGRTGVEKAILGSVAESIVGDARCPVLSVGPRATTDSRSAAELSRILYATDFSSDSFAALPYAISLCREDRAQLFLLNCLEEGGDARMRLRELQKLVPPGADLRSAAVCVAERGPHGKKIPEVCEALGADLLVLGVAARRDLLAQPLHVRQPALYQIVTQATCPVLTFRSQAR